MQQTLAPDEDDVDDLLTEQNKAELEKSFLSRSMRPIVKKFGALFRGSARASAGAQVRDMLEQAGHPLGMHYPEFLGLKLFCLIAFTGIGVLSGAFIVPILLNVYGMGGDPMTTLMMQGLWVLIGAYAGFSGPTFWLRKVVNKRLKAIRKSMADVVDLIILAIEAGLGFDQAVGQAVAKTNGPSVGRTGARVG